ncbi:hypothetical protein Acor_53860 [Acrocarpospora corrugata]|uniref:Uncharacterized protein n=1 Tax=Acrocarpospora corrugata TaxID=35763 RepID=A0A5M3W4Z0_9ACTN|nr:hypothetical protein Acor_53860 [Acrocarpospora corrugata]
MMAMVAGVAVTNSLSSVITGPSVRPLSAEEVRQELDIPITATPSPSAIPTSTRTASPPVRAPREIRVIATSGGSAVAACVGGEASLLSWTPAQGYHVDDVDPGPHNHAKVKFEANDTEVELEVHCEAGRPVSREKHD